MLVAWGATKFFATRSSPAAHDSVGRQNLNDWTFGQMLPVLLLAAPIWSLLGAFVLSDRSEQTSYLGQEHDDPLMTVSAVLSPSTPGLATSQNLSAAPSRVNSRGTGTIPEIHRNDSTATLASGAYAYCYWIGPCLSAQCGLILAMPFLQILLNAADALPLITFWITNEGMIYLLLLVYPLASQFSILLGLIQEAGLLGDRGTLEPSHSNARRVLLWLTFLAVWGFFIVLWYFFATRYGWVELGNTDGDPRDFPPIRYGVMVVGTAVLHFLYASGYFLRLFRERSRMG